MLPTRHYENGQAETATRSVRTLAEFFWKHKWRFENIIDGTLDAATPMNRPHVRFNGNSLGEVEENWPHAQNDALGYFLWLYCKLRNAGVLASTEMENELLALFPLYFDAIRFWEDEDNGHWEETRKIEASSIGVVLGGLRELRRVIENDASVEYRYREKIVTADLVDRLMARGAESLARILPSECIQDDPLKRRRYDAALLFLICPMEVVHGEIADQIVEDVVGNLQGEYGIRRYNGDSFWSADYKEKLPPELRTADFSDARALRKRDDLLQPGQEAQWCIFDPIMSVIFARKFQRLGDESFLDRQIHYLNRSLGQLTGADSAFGELKCPELYHIENGRRAPSDSTPLLWTQANLWMALQAMERSLLQST